jgi:hypothetical protein
MSPSDDKKLMRRPLVDGLVSVFDLRGLQPHDVFTPRFFDWRRPMEQPLARFPESESSLAQRFRVRREP